MALKQSPYNYGIINGFKVKILIVGCGSIGKRYILNLINLKKSIAVFNRSSHRLNEFKYSDRITIYDDIELAYKQFKPSVTFICTPANTHLLFIKKAIKNNNWVFVEKPIVNLKTEKKHFSLSRNKSKNIFVSCNMRFHWGPKKIKKIIDENLLGKLYFSRIHCGSYLPDWHPNEDYSKNYSASSYKGGGVLLDIIHEIDLNCWLFGFPKKVKSFVSKISNLNIQTEDLANILFLYKDKFQTHININYLQKPVSRGIFIQGELGNIEWSLEDKKIIYYNKNKNRTYMYYEPKKWDHNSMYLNQTKYFIDLIKQRNLNINNFDYSYKVINLIKKIKASSLN
ncbi:Gfo/Idh/MocA family oxidoreductase [Alphaproteobacteria bacterium]|nr:Gfo/Idh/MocA family oxidoreductase [Alphaproteobacteria bacterium]